MVKKTLKIQKAIVLAIMLALVAPVGVMAKDGKKHFKEGMKYEENRQWDKAAEQFALAVAEKPSNVEYQLHLHRALVNAAIMLVERGDMLAEKKDYKAAYQAYRQAYAFDPANELALIKMRRMLEAQGLPTDSIPDTTDPSGPRLKPKNGDSVKTSYNGVTKPGTTARKAQLLEAPGRKFPQTEVSYNNSPLLSIIEHLAQDMGLNVIFDQQVSAQLRNNKVSVELRGVTRPRALDMILKTNNLMYAQLDTRTIVIALDNPQARMRYEPFSVRTFYVKNADINDLRNAITSTLQSKQVVPIKQLNALIVRDTPSNLELIESMINSLDKSKAEVLIDVNIYEVSRNDLLQLGNQFTTTGSDRNPLGASNLGGIGQPGFLGLGPRTLTGPLGFALGLPSSTISFFQDKGKAKLLASTQVHILDREQQSIRIGQRVPIQTATLPTFNVPTDRQQRQAQQQTGVSAADQFLGLGGFGGVGIPQIQYENVGLNIDMTPEVYEDDVQMKMKIESTSVDTSTGKLTPSFNQRTMNSVARIKDGQTTLVAGVSQNVESKSIKGFPIIGLIPILGRFFSTPETENRQSDVVITVTPHILRRADITEEDHLAREAGTASDPSTQLTLEQILYLADIEDTQRNQVAGSNGTTTEQQKTVTQPVVENKPAVNNPPQSTPGRIDSPGVVVMPTSNLNPPGQAKPNISRETVPSPGVQPVKPPATRPSAVVDEDDEGDDDDDDDDDDDGQPQNAQRTAPVLVTVKPASAVATKNQDLYVAIIVNGNTDINYTNISLNYDPNILEIKGVRDGGLLRAGGANPALNFSADGGLLNVQMERPAGTSGVPARGQLLLIVFSVKGQGQSPLTLNEGQTFFRTPNNTPVQLRLQSSQVEVR
jgi:general secretion pathway protein D